MMLTLALVVFGLLQAPGENPGQNDVRTTLERLETEWNVAHVRGDAAALDRIFSDDVVVIVPGMRVMTKADAVGMFRSGRMKFDKYDTSETTFRILDDTAIVTGRLKRTRGINGATTDDDWRFTEVYIRRADRWQVISFHASNTAS
jgi:ketosteroid isomerase-like protein